MNKELGTSLFFLCIGMLNLRTSISLRAFGKITGHSNVRRQLQFTFRGLGTNKDNKGHSMNGATGPLRSLDEFGKGPNTLLYYLKGEKADAMKDGMKDGSQLYPRQLRKMHFTCVLPEHMPSPYLIAASSSCAIMLEVDPAVIHTERFTRAFCGNELLPGLDTPYATVYGCHCYGQWFGQLGDGRALSIGEVYTSQPIREHEQRTIETLDSTVTAQKALQLTQRSPAQGSSYGDHLYELQLKGCGRSPFSRGFDGRAVLRSSVREYLVSEAMHHLRVPTTRALSIIGTGQAIARPWYAATCNTYAPATSHTHTGSADSTSDAPPQQAAKSVPENVPENVRGKFAPNVMLSEPGAVLCRVSRSFLRFGQLELFAMRREFEELQQLADYVCFREYPHLLGHRKTDGEGRSEGDSSSIRPLPPAPLPPGPPSRYVNLYRCIAQRTAQLVADWLRVGYVQGNMNSDNTLLGGRTIDYGPYGWMERFDPFYQPFTSDKSGNFAFVRQPTAMTVNVQVLGETTMAPLVQYAYTNYLANLPDSDTDSTNTHSDTAGSDGSSEAHPGEPLESLEELLAQVQRIHEVEFAQYFTAAYNEVKRCKLGLHSFVSNNGGNSAEQATSGADQQLWQDLELLMVQSHCDFTILYRELGNVAHLFATYDHAPATASTATTAAAVPGDLAPKTSQAPSQATKQATMAVPSSPEISLFPNIAFASSNGGGAGIAVGGAGESIASASITTEQALTILSAAFYDPTLLGQTGANPRYDIQTNHSDQHPPQTLQQQWMAWLQRYHDRIRQDPLTPTDRRRMQDRNNPKFVLRNWMAAVANEKAAKGDYSLIAELTALLEHPYDEQSAELTAKWYVKTPSWASNLPGVTFMS